MVTGAHDCAVTVQLNCSTVGPDCVGGGCVWVGVGDVGEFELEHPTANSNTNAHSVRFTTSSRCGGIRTLLIDYSEFVPA
jgi:hypothetical protein